MDTVEINTQLPNTQCSLTKITGETLFVGLFCVTLFHIRHPNIIAADFLSILNDAVCVVI